MMLTSVLSPLFLAAYVALPRPQSENNVSRAPLTSLERQAGWRSLFNGRTAAGWRALASDRFPERGWVIEEGLLHHLPRGGGGDIVADFHGSDFEFEFEWKAAPGANSGVKYRVADRPGAGSMLGPEYQVLDETGHANPAAAKHRTGALYDVVPPAVNVEAPAGRFHRARIVADGDHIEHWLNGVRVVSADLGSESWQGALSRSKFRSQADFARKSGRIGLQDHGDEVWYRNLKLRDLDRLPGRSIELYNGKDLSGWRARGDAIYETHPDGILGKTGKGGHSFLMTERNFGDFLFEVELRNELPGNSGIQIRSHQRENGGIYGYQIEIDPSERSWSGGLYDEGRRGWLQNLAENEAGRKAFRVGEWNRYRIECLGPWIRTWVNGVPVTDYFDIADLEGFLALQVHGGSNTRVYWRNMKLHDLGTRAWKPIEELGARSGTIGLGEHGDASLRLQVSGRSAPLRIELRRPQDSINKAPTWRKLGSRIQASSHGYRIDLDPQELGERWKADGDNEIGLCHYGDRLALLLNGRSLADVRAPEVPARGRVRLSPLGEDRIELKAAALLGPPAPSPDSGPLFAHLGATRGDAEGLEAIRSAFQAANPGYELDYFKGRSRYTAGLDPAALFLQSEGGLGVVLDVEGRNRDNAELHLGDIVLLRSGEVLESDQPIEAVVYRVPQAWPDALPVFIQPDHDPAITDSPGGCATEHDAYRRILLTWLESVGPYVYHGLNAHRVRITDSFSHYHPREGGFDEFYLVQDLLPGGELLTSTQVERILDPESVDAPTARTLLQRHELQVGDLVYLPRGTMHRGLGGALVQVITVPGFRPGAEIGLDAQLAGINERLRLEGRAALPVHAKTLAPEPAAAPRPGLRHEDGPNYKQISYGDQLITRYHFGDTRRPFFYPLNTPEGIPLTRGYPIEAHPGEAQDHPHHTSLWFAHGDINGHDYWHIGKQALRVEMRDFEWLETDAEHIAFRADHAWLAGEGDRERIVLTDSLRCDLQVSDALGLALRCDYRLKAGQDEVRFGDTKEGSFALRLHPALRLKGKVATGRILNSTGARNGEAWGKRARWVDYSGTIEGQELGVLLRESADNFRHPTWWHARDYGLLAANPFGIHDFEKEPAGRGDHTLDAGQELHLAYTIYAHDGILEPVELERLLIRWDAEAAWRPALNDDRR